MKNLAILLVGSAFCLTGCDIATEAAKEQIGGQVRTAVVEQCQSVSEGFGIASDMIAPVCECTADTFLEKSADEMTQVDRARVEEIVRDCASAQGAEAPTAETENTGG